MNQHTMDLLPVMKEFNWRFSEEYPKLGITIWYRGYDGPKALCKRELVKLLELAGYKVTKGASLHYINTYH